MYRENDIVVYGIQGVCKIVEIAEKEFGGSKREYYVLKPVSNPGTTLFAPKDNRVVLSKIRRVLTKEEVRALVASAAGEEPEWIANDNLRRDAFKQLLDSGDHRSLILMIKAIWLHKKARAAEGKRLHMADERFLKDAEQLLYDEFRYVLEISKEDLISYIFHTD